MGIEIERKFTVKELPADLEKYPYHEIEQAYLNVNPAIRVRRQDDIYYMTYKCKEDLRGMGANSDAAAGGRQSAGDRSGDEGDSGKDANIGQTEYNMPLNRESYEHLKSKADGNVIMKKRYLIPLNEDAFDAEFEKAGVNLDRGTMKIELDVFEGVFEGRVLAEVEFPSEEAAKAYKAAYWFDNDVTSDIKYSNSQMSREKV